MTTKSSEDKQPRVDTDGVPSANSGAGTRVVHRPGDTPVMGGNGPNVETIQGVPVVISTKPGKPFCGTPAPSRPEPKRDESN